MDTTFVKSALDEYIEWQNEDKKTLKKINELIKSIQRDGFLKGIGHPEKLKYLKGYSREIDKKNRLHYDGIEFNNLVILSCKGHYEDT